MRRGNCATGLVIVSVLCTTLFYGGCFSTRGIEEISVRPYPIIYEDDSAIRFGDRDDTVLMEVRRAEISGPLENLAIHYRSFFPEGEIVRPGDLEEYLTVDGHDAYRVDFRRKYIRKRKRAEDGIKPENVPQGWSLQTIVDPTTGKPVPVLNGPVIPREKIMYLVEGDRYLYYVFMRADGEAIEPTVKKFEKFVSEGIDYK